MVVAVVFSLGAHGVAWPFWLWMFLDTHPRATLEMASERTMAYSSDSNCAHHDHYHHIVIRDIVGLATA